mgnify:CR=1 FL=1
MSSYPRLSKKVLGALSFQLLETLSSGFMLYNKSNEILYLNTYAKRLLHIPTNTYQTYDVLDFFAEHPHSNIPLSESFFQGSMGMCYPLLRESQQNKSDLHREALQITYRFNRFYPPGKNTEVLYGIFFDHSDHLSHNSPSQNKSLHMTSITRLLPTIAHEIKNPIAGIQGMIEILHEEVEQKQHKEDLEIILDELTRLSAIVDRMRLAEPSQLKIRYPVNLTEIAQKAMKTFQRRVQLHHVSLYYMGDEDIQMCIHPDLVRMILINLLNNALDASKIGSRIVVSMLQLGDELELAVIDTGHGMTREVQHQATEPFFTTRKDGSGIGLALIKYVVEESMGRLDIKSEPNRGTRITIRLLENT